MKTYRMVDVQEQGLEHQVWPVLLAALVQSWCSFPLTHAAETALISIAFPLRVYAVLSSSFELSCMNP